MRILVALFACVSVALFSCQKEVDFANGNNGGNNGNGGGNSGGVLTKVVSKSGSDSSTLIFGFNSSQRLMTLGEIAVSGGTTATTQERVERDGQGTIKKLILKNDAYAQQGIDSVETIIGYSAGKYVSKVTTIDLGVFLYRDSVALIYDGNGKVVTEATYDDIGTGSYDPTSKLDYTYSGNNIASINVSAYDASTSLYTVEETFTYDQYDIKPSPMTIGVEAFVFDSPELFSANNPTSSSIAASGSATQTYSTTYTYNSSNKPTTASSTIQPGGSVVTGAYYYQ